MSVIFVPPRVTRIATAEWHSTATAWHECCLEVFSRAERSIDECIASLEESGRSLVRYLHDKGCEARGRALARYLESERFSPHWRASVGRLKAWDATGDDLLFFTSGRLIVRPGEIDLSLSAPDGKAETSPKTRTLNSIQMLVFLRELDESQRALHSQLGQIRAAARESANDAA